MFRVTENLIFRPSSGSRRVRRPGSGGFSPVSAPRRSLFRSLDCHGDPVISNLIIWVRSRIPNLQEGWWIWTWGEAWRSWPTTNVCKTDHFLTFGFFWYFERCPPQQKLPFLNVTLFKKPVTTPSPPRFERHHILICRIDRSKYESIPLEGNNLVRKKLDVKKVTKIVMMVMMVIMAMMVMMTMMVMMVTMVTLMTMMMIITTTYSSKAARTRLPLQTAKNHRWRSR